MQEFETEDLHLSKNGDIASSMGELTKLSFITYKA